MVDDDPASRALVGSTVGEMGHTCSYAASGRDALKHIKLESPEVVLASTSMPDMDGVELCTQVRARRDGSGPYLIVVAPEGDNDAIVAALDAGADDVLTRPVEPFALRVRMIAAERGTALARRAEQATRRAQQAQSRLEQVARTDPLTRLGNRLRLDEDLAALHARARRDGSAYAVAMVDVDHFKPYNDHHGHQAGDAALRAVADAVAESCRAGDRAYRYGGEELVVLFHREGLAEASNAAERLRRAVRDLGIRHHARPDGGTLLTVSAGVAGFDPSRHARPGDVLEEADRALYRAKGAGRDQIAVADGDAAAASG